MEKLPMGKKDCETSNEMMQAGYVPTGILDTLVCKGRVDPRNGKTHWAVTQSHFHVFQQFIVTRTDMPSEWLEYFFLGEGCDKRAPKRPNIEDEDCFWAMKSGSWFHDGHVKNLITALPGGTTQFTATRACIQEVWGKPGYKMKCFLRGLDPEFDEIKKGPSPHGYEWLTDVTDPGVPVDKLWAKAHGADYKVQLFPLKPRCAIILKTKPANASQCGSPRPKLGKRELARSRTPISRGVLRPCQDRPTNANYANGVSC